MPYSTASRAECLAAIDKPGSNPDLAEALHKQMWAYVAELPTGSERAILKARNDFEQVAAEALFRAITEDGVIMPDTVEVVMLDMGGLEEA